MSGSSFRYKDVRHALNGDRFQRRVGQNDFFVTFRRRIAFVGGIDVRPKHFAQVGQLRHEEIQKLFRLGVGRVARRIISEAFANLRLEAVVQSFHSAARHIGQIAGVEQRLRRENRETSGSSDRRRPIRWPARDGRMAAASR